MYKEDREKARQSYREEEALQQAIETIEHPDFDLRAVREDFPFLHNEDHPVVYLDNGATSQRPEPVIERLADYYRYENANPLRGNHYLSLASTQAYEAGRDHIRRFIHADRPEEVVFTRNTTESLNLLAYEAALYLLKEGDEVLISRMEHHSNSVPWQFACQRTGAKLVYVDIDEDYSLDMDDFEAKLNDHTRIVSITGTSNVLGAVPDLKRIIQKAHQKGAYVIVDGAQLVPHQPVNVKELDCDFLAFSGHKMLAPFGLGVLYGKKELLEAMPPFLYGGEMIEYVHDQDSTFAPLPYKFEAGTQNVGGVVGLDAAMQYMEEVGLEAIERYEKALGDYCAIRLRHIPFVTVYHPSYADRGSVVAFNIDQIHPHDASTIFDSMNIAIRSGHHCAQQLHARLCTSASCRASLAFYNTREEVDRFLEAIPKICDIMGVEREGEED